MIDVDALTLDKDNPRIQAALEFYDPKDIDDIKIGLALVASTTEFEGSGTTFLALKDSIKRHGGLINPIIVSHSTKENTFTVVEGNTRVYIYKILRKDNVDGDWNKIPAVVYEDLEKIEIDAIRLQAHLVGPRNWDPYSKAKYLYKLSTEDNLTLSQLVDFCGGKRKDIMDYIKAYDLMETYYRPVVSSDENFDKNRFSAFVEVQRGTIEKALADAGFTHTDFSQWIYDDKFEKLDYIRQLPRIFANKKAKEIFIKKGAKAACDELIAQQTGGVDISKTKLDILAKEITKKIRSLQYQELRDIRDDPDAVNMIAELLTEIEYLFKDVSSSEE